MGSTDSGPEHRLRRSRAWVVTVSVIVIGVGATVAISLGARANYQHNEQRLTALQTRLSGQVIDGAIQQLGGQLDRVVGLTAESAQPVTTFDQAIAPLMKPKGQFNSVVLVLVRSSPTVLQHVGAAPIKDPSSPALLALYERAAKSSSLLVNRVVAGRFQRFGYLVSARGPAGTYVIAAGSELPSSRQVTLPASSPDSVLNFALYYGTRPSPSSLIETNASRLPIQGAVATEVVAFGSQHLVLVASPRVSLAGSLSENLPWATLVVGLLLTLAVGLFVRRLAFRRREAEEAAEASRRLAEEQSQVSKQLQLALLPKNLPVLEGAELSARYLPAARALEVGGDWYSAVEINENQLAFVVGDVSGHGLSAATAMAPLRFSVRTLAKLGLSPATILEHADTEIDLIEDDHYATVLVGIVDLSTRICTLASAGHPLPFVVTEDGCHQLQLPVGPPLGVHEARFTEHVVHLPANAILVAFTDGLVERRGDSIDRCIDRLRQLLNSRELSTADAAVERALVLVEDKDHEDDVAVIALRMVTPTGHQQPPDARAIPTAVVGSGQLVGADEAD